MPEVFAAMVGGVVEAGAGLCAGVTTGERTTMQNRRLARMDIFTMRAQPSVAVDMFAGLAPIEL
jgi:hypothetical protein